MTNAIPSTPEQVLALFREIYQETINIPTNYLHPDPDAIPPSDHQDNITYITQKVYAFSLLNALTNLTPKPTFYIVGKRAPENSSLHIPGGSERNGFSRIEGVFFKLDGALLYMTLGGISTARYKSSATLTEYPLAQDAPTFAELYQTGQISLRGTDRVITLLVDDLQLNAQTEATLTEENTGPLRVMIAQAGERTTQHMQPFRDALNEERRQIAERAEAERARLEEDHENEALMGQYQLTQRTLAEMTEMDDAIRVSIANAVASGVNSLHPPSTQPQPSQYHPQLFAPAASTTGTPFILDRK